jgi:hypothetical protein
LLFVLAGWTNGRQQDVIDFQNAQVDVLMEQLGRRAGVGQNSIMRCYAGHRYNP